MNDSLEPGLTNPNEPRIGIIIPACDEAQSIARVLTELLGAIDPAKYAVAVGVNDSSDRTAAIAREFPVIVAETTARGYGHGCRAAIEELQRAIPSIRAYVFFAGDGASAPRDIAPLVAAYEQGYSLVLGARTALRSNWSTMMFSHVFANVVLGAWCGLLTGRWFRDLAPLRLIARDLFETLAPREMTFGWTIEPQIGAAMLGANICEISAHERRRIGGEQKVSGVTWRRTFTIGCRILSAGWRARRRYALAGFAGARSRPVELVAQTETGA
ncbi:MAG: glycosyltransferase [Chthoniobacterales bacterium]